MQLVPAVFDIVIVFERKVRLWRDLGHVRVLELHITVEVVEVVETFLKLPFAVTRAHMDHVHNYVLTVDELALVFRQLDL